MSRAAKRFNIRSTPTMVFPDGRVVPGAIGAGAILSYLQDPEAPPGEKPAENKK